jgi:hypothetical protein
MDSIEPDEFGDLFNSRLEAGIRSVVVLESLRPETADLSEMVLFDYIVVHTSDLGGPPSLHADLPDRKGELLVRRRLVEAGLHLMHRCHLVEQESVQDGLAWRASDDAASYVELLETAYSIRLRTCAAWLCREVRARTKAGFKAFVRQELGEWHEAFSAYEIAACGFDDGFANGALPLHIGQRGIDHVSQQRLIVAELTRRLHHEDDRQMLLRISPKRGSCSTGPVVITGGTIRGGYTLLPAYGETEAEPIAGSGKIGCRSRADLAQMVRGHEGDRRGAQDAMTVESATILQHLQEPSIIHGRGHHALAAGFPTGGEARIADRLSADDFAVSREWLGDQILFREGH